MQSIEYDFTEISHNMSYSRRKTTDSSRMYWNETDSINCATNREDIKKSLEVDVFVVTILLYRE